MSTDREIAKTLLLTRATGFSIRRFMRKSVRRYFLSLLAALALLAGAVYEEGGPMKLFFVAGFGMYCGAFLRDAGWLRRMKKDWAFISRIIDWQRVEAMAEGNESAKQASEVTAPELAEPQR
ncbi:MAG: hypothetical protein NTU88_14775 [Armatimonadetes bacterium]|nr:hypothetical protein [Armatimonadota bacterium]